jgi:hypothetical protein
MNEEPARQRVVSGPESRWSGLDQERCVQLGLIGAHPKLTRRGWFATLLHRVPEIIGRGVRSADSFRVVAGRGSSLGVVIVVSPYL